MTFNGRLNLEGFNTDRLPLWKASTVRSYGERRSTLHLRVLGAYSGRRPSNVLLEQG